MLRACLNAFSSPLSLALCMSPFYLLSVSLPTLSLHFLSTIGPLTLWVFFLYGVFQNGFSGSVSLSHFFCRCLFHFWLSLPNSLFGLISRSPPSHCATSLLLFLLFFRFYFSIHQLPISNIEHSILIKGYLLDYVSFFFFYIAYSWFSLHPPILLLLLSGVKKWACPFSSLHLQSEIRRELCCPQTFTYSNDDGGEIHRK